MADGVIDRSSKILDYGCGRGDDVRRLSALGYQASGWDPAHRPSTQLEPSDVVNLGYVVNVIEDVGERCDALRRAWALAERLLICSARLAVEGRELRDTAAFGDGCLTNRGTFQKFFEQQELRNWIERTLDVTAVPAAPGVFYVFADDQARSAFVASQYRRRGTTALVANPAALFAAHEELLGPLTAFVADRGRLPFDDEIAAACPIVEVFGSLRKAFGVIVAATDDVRWQRLKLQHSQDLLVYLALAQFEGRPRFGALPLALQRDVRAFFGSYKKACHEADGLLFSLGEPGVVESACRRSPIGKLTPGALYVHQSALSKVAAVLRLYEGCARAFWGRVEGANLVKLHLGEPKVSYLSYPDFDSDPHPALASAVSIHLQTFRVRARDYRSAPNRPILHRKELLVPPEYPGRDKFARLTRIEESKGLFEDTTRIGLEQGWHEALAQRGLYLRGHRLLVADRQRSAPPASA